jgi:hypothetical protein
MPVITIRRTDSCMDKPPLDGLKTKIIKGLICVNVQPGVCFYAK